MINFMNVVGVSDSYGNVVQITDGVGNIVWAVQSNKSVILEVEKITSDTYAGETTYTGEEFILLDIYPKTNGIVNVTYGGLTKTITDTSGAEEPNAQQVFFGTFNGVSDGVITPASGTLTIEGDYYAFGCGRYSSSSKDTLGKPMCACVTEITDFGSVKYIPEFAFGTLSNGACKKITKVIFSESVTKIEKAAFTECTALLYVKIPKNVAYIGMSAFVCQNESSLEIVEILATTPPQLGYTESDDGTKNYAVVGVINDETYALKQLIVPKGCGNAYKTADGWSQYADCIVEVS